MCSWISWSSWSWEWPCFFNLHFMLSNNSVISWIWYMCFHDLVPKVGSNLAYDAKCEKNYEVAAQLFPVVIVFSWRVLAGFHDYHQIHMNHPFSCNTVRPLFFSLWCQLFHFNKMNQAIGVAFRIMGCFFHQSLDLQCRTHALFHDSQRTEANYNSDFTESGTLLCGFPWEAT